ncbi:MULTISPECIES: hypothetical protein [unclassified Rathayibacter]|uniref:hypothetical protein n=1 Tax=unclassified Rathayibacter TaxID=2609250 RepID=UPI000F91CA44|nr:MULTISPECIES: hypothetical protein [unclassified Rathayibacter]MCJ1702711.1 hypothetical protein [Rathayibacter sp. VKM Ac-2926]ROP48635.1 hypothetical protein EDF45_2752 [Rathayibacter sp. PhB186]ROS49784.1 hypothetical protein EDF44_2754 [Rathayibacter sp. PhB185]TCL80150.1 hypothetical protein EDF49_11095 [Rathayibacter sp. PhB192]TCM25591.1 hypothetical protein EDF43_11095 [Rathayibacter sp. PhB179]
MSFNSRRWQVRTIVARVQATAALSTSTLDTAARADRKLEILRIADGVDAGRVSNDEAVAAFERLAQDVGHTPEARLG